MPDAAPIPPTERGPAGGEAAGSKPPMIPRNPRFVTILFGLLLLNLVLSFATGRPVSRGQVPYQPFFVTQLNANNVRQITSRADSLEGDLVKGVRYDPPGSAKPVEVTRFKTQVPAFIDRAALTRL